MIKKGTKVSWISSKENQDKGSGTVIFDEADGYVLVAITPGAYSDISPVIYCPVSFLVVVQP